MSGSGRAKKYPSKQWHTIKSKLKKSGKWKEPERAKLGKRSEVNADGSKRRRLEEPEAGPSNVPDIVQAFEEEGKLIAQSLIKSMSGDNGKQRKQSRDLFIESDSDTSDLELGKIYEARTSNTKINLEGESLRSREKLPVSPVPFFHEGGDFSRETWEIERTFRDIQISDAARERLRVARVPKTEGKIWDNTIILQRSFDPLFWYDFKESYPDYILANYKYYEDYFQSMKSLCVVIRCLPDDPITTKDLYDKLICEIDEPFMIICELSRQGILHWHLLWFTSKRSDNAQRTLRKAWENFAGYISTAAEKTHSNKHFLRYMLKKPITIGVGNCTALTKYCYSVFNEITSKPYEKPLDKQSTLEGYPNAMVKDIIDAMNKTNKYTFEELVRFAPQIMKKYLGRPNIESIVSNCKLYLTRPNDVSLTMERVCSGDWVIQCLFPMWCILKYQGIDNPGNFFVDFWNVFFKMTDKINVLAIQGPSNTGKTSYIRPLTSIFNFGEIVQGGQFMFQNCINKEMLIWEEPLIGGDYIEMCKRVFEGMTTQVNIKFKAPQTLYRTPILITTNKDVWHYCDSDSEALKNRMYLYMFTNPATLPLYRSSDIRKYWREYSCWLTTISEYVTGCDSYCTSGPQYCPAEELSNECWYHRNLYISCSDGSKLCSTGSEPDNERTSRVDDRRRNSSNEREIQQRTERSRSPINHSTSANNSDDGTGTSTGSTTGLRGESDEGFTLYAPGTTHNRSDNRIGGKPRLIGGGDSAYDSGRDSTYSRKLREYIYSLHRCGRRYRVLEEIYGKGQLPKQPRLDREISVGELDEKLYQQTTKEHWLTLIYLGLLICKTECLL